MFAIVDGPEPGYGAGAIGDWAMLPATLVPRDESIILVGDSSVPVAVIPDAGCNGPRGIGCVVWLTCPLVFDGPA